jgi:LytS/YehU family sensor histidine kinase
MAKMRAEAAAGAATNRALEAVSLAQQHELRQLQAQVNPHFLFNSLNTVAAIKDDPEAVEQVTQDLADYLRFALRDAGTLEPLSRELRALVKYLSVQKRRFGSNLDCRITADTAAPRVLVPPMMIQPLLENALHYGSKTSAMPLRVTVRAHVHDGWLQVAVANSGQWVPPDPARSPNTGIHSLRRRLKLLIDETATVDVEPESDNDGDCVRVVIRLPVTPKGRPAGVLPDPA